jgi:hypothetical protein
MMTSGIKKQNPLIQTTEIQQSLTTDCILFQIKKKNLIYSQIQNLNKIK